MKKPPQIFLRGLFFMDLRLQAGFNRVCMSLISASLGLP